MTESTKRAREEDRAAPTPAAQSPRPVTGGKGPGIVAYIIDETHAARVSLLAHGQNARAVYGGKGTHTRMLLWGRALKAQQELVHAEEQEVEDSEQVSSTVEDSEQVSSTRDEERAAKRVKKALDEAKPGAIKTGLWTPSDVQTVEQWVREHEQDDSTRGNFSAAFRALALAVQRTERGTFQR